MSLSASLPKIDQRVFLKGEHQAAVVFLGHLALSNPDSAELTTQAISLVTQVLQPDYCLFGELVDDGQRLSFKSGWGGDADASALAMIPMDVNSLEGNTLSSTTPIVVENFHNGSRFKPSSLVQDLEVRSGVSVRIGTDDQPYGVIQVFSQQVQYFSQSDVQFLQSVANLLGLALRQGSFGRELLPPQIPVSAQPRSQSSPLEWDRYEIKNRLIESREKERLHLAQDLHDIPIQDLYGMIYQLDDLRETLKDPEGERIVNECDYTLHKVVNSLRTICRDLRPPSLSPFGLEVAIRDHMEKFRDQIPDINVNLELMRDQQTLSDSLRLTLFRIYQQAVHNVARHAQATEIFVRFRLGEGTAILEIEDNGIGFDVPKHWMDLVHEERFGLLGIAERVESIRGKLEIVSVLGSGTLVRAIVPYT